MAISKDRNGCAEMRLVENILRFGKHFANAQKLRDKNVLDYFVYNTLAMECFQAVNALIEIGEHSNRGKVRVSVNLQGNL
jgi:hypothetical protein